MIRIFDTFQFQITDFSLLSVENRGGLEAEKSFH